MESQEEPHEGQKEKSSPNSPIKFWGVDRLSWLKALSLGFPPLVEIDKGFEASSRGETAISIGGDADEGQTHIKDTSGSLDQEENPPPPVQFDGIVLPYFAKPMIGRGQFDVSRRWRHDLPNILISKTNLLDVRIALDGEQTEEDLPNECRYLIISPDLGIPTIALDRQWRESQGDNIPMMQIGATRAFDPEEEKTSGSFSFSGDGTGDLLRRGWEERLKSMVSVLLLERSGDGLFRRAGL